MGSRAVAIVCRDDDAARERFGVLEGGPGILYTRTGRPFFNDEALQNALLLRLRAAVAASGLWDELDTRWLCLDCELLPWSAKAQELLRGQYAAVGAAARAAGAEAVSALAQTASANPAAGPLLERFQARAATAEQYVQAYRHYAAPAETLDDYRLAPFHLLASEGAVHLDRDHAWHMTQLARLATDPLVLATPYRLVDVTDAASQAEATAWWEALTGRGGEGMVVKPLAFVARGRRGLAQPAVKCRGREYLRLIYGPEYDLPENLARLRERGLGGKRSLALREFALGVEALERFALRREPLYRVHECVFGVLALESEPVDPRL
jgi:protein phosphatase